MIDNTQDRIHKMSVDLGKMDALAVELLATQHQLNAWRRLCQQMQPWCYDSKLVREFMELMKGEQSK